MATLGVTGLVQPRATDVAPGSLLEMRGITKAYGATVANDRIDFDLRSGEIHALLGENGAGKTTLMNVLFGLVQPDVGSITIDTHEVHFDSPRDALARGIGMVHQHFMLVNRFSVAENVVLGTVSPWNLSFRRLRIEREVLEAAKSFGIHIDPTRRVRDLPIDLQQRVEILKLLYRGANILILDEPTSALGPVQADALVETLKDLRAGGRSVVIVTHKLGEVMAVADRVTVLKQGRVCARATRGGFDEQMLAQAMTGRTSGRTLTTARLSTARASESRPPIFEIKNLVVRGKSQLNAVHGVTLSVPAGEILGVAGVEGNGQKELVDAVAGVVKPDGGTIVVDGRDISRQPPRQRLASGLGVIPEDRQAWGLVLDMNVAENLALAAIAAGRFSKKGLIRRKSIRAAARRLLQEYDVRPPNPDLRVAALSGGNQQKIVLARELSRKPKVLLAANPTRGLDVGATDYVHQRLLAARATGSAIILVSHDLDELLALSDRVIVLFRGKVLYEAYVEELSRDTVALAMAGTTPSRRTEHPGQVVERT